MTALYVIGAGISVLALLAGLPSVLDDRDRAALRRYFTRARHRARRFPRLRVVGPAAQTRAYPQWRMP